jgi:hypothetical protein
VNDGIGMKWAVSIDMRYVKKVARAIGGVSLPPIEASRYWQAGKQYREPGYDLTQGPAGDLSSPHPQDADDRPSQR